MSQVIGKYQAKDTLLQKHLAKVEDLMKWLDAPDIQHVPKKENTRANILSELASTNSGGNNQSLIQEMQKSPSIAKTLPTLAIEGSLNRMTPIIQYLWNTTRPEDFVEAKRMVRKASYYTIIEGQLYRRGLS